MKNPLLLALSTQIQEDFGVSIAQAQAAGWPVALTDWGGHSAVTGPDVCKIPPLAAGHGCEPRWLVQLRARSIAHWLMTTPWGMPETAAPKGPEPAQLSLEQLDSIRRRFVLKTGGAAQQISREDVASFADTPSGRDFFRNYRDLFSTSSDRAAAVLIAGLDDPGLERRLEELQERGPVVVLSTEDLGQKQALLLLAGATEIHAPGVGERILEKLRRSGFAITG